MPRVDTADQVGQYQDGVLQQDPQGTWSLVSLQTLGKGTVYDVLGITSVEVVKTDGLPASVYLRVLGVDPSCDTNGPQRIHQRLVGSHIDVNISAPHVKPYTGVFVCTANVRPYKITVALDVYGLAAGVYAYNVNGVRTGTFTLDRDNRFPDDCSVQKFGAC